MTSSWIYADQATDRYFQWVKNEYPLSFKRGEIFLPKLLNCENSGDELDPPPTYIPGLERVARTLSLYSYLSVEDKCT